MKIREIIGEAIFTSHKLYNPEDARGPYNMTPGMPGPFDISYQEDEEDSGLTTCYQCDGTGKGKYPGSRCGICKGEGVIDHRDFKFEEK